MLKRKKTDELEMLREENRLLRNKLRLALGSSAPGMTLMTTIAGPETVHQRGQLSIDGMSDAVLRVSDAGKVLYANSRMREMLSVSKAESQNLKLDGIDTLAWAPNVFETLLSDARLSGQTIEYETVREHPLTGAKEYYVFTAKIVEDNIGQVLVRDVSDLRRIREHFTRHVDPRVLEKILSLGVNVLEHERLIVTMLFADLRGFTSLSRTKAPEEVAAMLNDCFAVAFEVIDRFQGTIDKIVGDEVMALFGAPLSQSSDPYRAVLCAIEMQRAHAELRRRYQAEGREMPPMGIGINTGPVVAGNIGTGRRVDYTVIGQDVNLASRLCSAAEPDQIILSRQTLDAVGAFAQAHPDEASEVLRLKPAGEVPAKGYPEPVKVYRALWSTTESQI